MRSAQLLRVADGHQSVRRSLSVGAGLPSTSKTAVSLLSTTKSAAAVGILLHQTSRSCAVPIL